MTEPRHPDARICPFLAFERVRDQRSAGADEHHRCYAAVRPAPISFSHQRTYCLSAQFPACPVFQDWAVRQAARPAEAGGTRAPVVPVPLPEGRPEPAETDRVVPAGMSEAPRPEDPPARPAVDPGLPGFLQGRAAGDVFQEGAWPRSAQQPGREDETPLARAAAERARRERSEPHAGAAGRFPQPAESAERFAPSAEAAERFAPQRAPDHRTPAWPVEQAVPAEPAAGAVTRARRQQRPPAARRRRVPIPGLVLAVLALALAGVLAFLLPGILAPDRGRAPRTSPRPTATAPVVAPTVDPGSPTATPAPTQHTYRVQRGDTLGRIARQFGLTVRQVLDANPGIDDPNQIEVGDEIIIPEGAAGGSPTPEP